MDGMGFICHHNARDSEPYVREEVAPSPAFEAGMSFSSVWRTTRCASYSKSRSAAMVALQSVRKMLRLTFACVARTTSSNSSMRSSGCGCDTGCSRGKKDWLSCGGGGAAVDRHRMRAPHCPATT
eukprot:scaffold187084_cov36-Tisochrysis_lutea.AAC.3